MSISLLLIDPAVKLTELVRPNTLSLHFAPAEHSSQYLSAYYIACSFHVPMKTHSFTLFLKLDILRIHLMFVLDRLHWPFKIPWMPLWGGHMTTYLYFSIHIQCPLSISRIKSSSCKFGTASCTSWILFDKYRHTSNIRKQPSSSKF